MITLRVAEIFQRVIGESAPVRLRAYDGSATGREDSPVTIEISSPVAMAHLASAPSSLGLARAYVSGELVVEGDIYEALSALADVTLRDVPRGEQMRLMREFAGIRLRNRVRPPEVENRRRSGFLHSKRRDAQAISHHYDVSNRFYEWVLGPSMAYTCAVYDSADTTLEQAQDTKHELVARKLGLEPGMRLLDVGCGWGGMVMHAARQGVHALGVTLSRSQAEWAQKAIVERGLADLAEVRHLDYRDVPETGFDRISSIGLTEHIGRAKLPGYFAFLYDRLGSGGRLLNHCITRPDDGGPRRTDPFIDRYVFPDGELHSIGHLVTTMNDAGFEIRHEENLREHYAATLAGWVANLEANWDDAVAEVGIERARVWLLYMAASRLAFERDNIQLHQVLGVRLGERASSGMGWRPDW